MDQLQKSSKAPPVLPPPITVDFSNDEEFQLEPLGGDDLSSRYL